MKQKDISLILVIAFASAILSFVVSRFVFSSPQSREQTVEKVDTITAEFTQPSRRYFNVEAVNPTQQIQIGNNNNPNPFNPKSP